MSKGLFDDVFDENKNRLSTAAQIAKGDAGNLYTLDLFETTVNFVFTVYSVCYKTANVALFFTAALLAINVLPRVMFKMTVYRFLRNNQDSKSFRVFGWIIQISFFICFGLVLITLYFAIDSKFYKKFIIISTLITYILGIMDKTVSLLLGKATKEAKNK